MSKLKSIGKHRMLNKQPQRKASLEASVMSEANPTQIDSVQMPTPESVADASRQKMIAEAAYFRAEQRGFEPGHEIEDWLAAEAEITGCSPHEVLRSSLQ